MRFQKLGYLFETQLHKEFSRIDYMGLLYSVSQKNPPRGVMTFLIFLTNGWEFFIDFLQTYYTFLSTLDYKFIFNYPRFWQSYATLSATTQFT